MRLGKPLWRAPANFQFRLTDRRRREPRPRIEALCFREIREAAQVFGLPVHVPCAPRPNNFGLTARVRPPSLVPEAGRGEARALVERFHPHS